ncbi:Cell wall-associated hydrolase, NlpC family [Streptomyces sp. DvalAA-14]|uniref:C40 family peptidase n=1 Tax=unclassified Streptomyces TaxID=2593676 RepID=UPI00081BC1C4|nr:MULTISPECIES: C40 family peptidase [unclassified Streptomyces]MYS19402.1 glycoside hydrolase [Streptomyces sp. SID4948]SCD43628.1 Cell wall-associated hydrolase, NlpC family [Streptomyces sp. DvalAA-14]
MATHRKARPAILSTPGPRAAVGLTTAALATVTLMTESASATPAPAKPAQPSIAAVQAKVNTLLHQAEVATEKYDGAKEKAEQQNVAANKALSAAAKKTQALNDSRRVLGEYAAAQYRDGGDTTTSRYLMSPDPQSVLEQVHLTGMLAKRQKAAVATYRVQQAAATQQRIEAGKSLATLTAQQAQLKTAKADVQAKLSQAQHLLNNLTAQEKARLAELQAQQEAAARAKAAKIAAQEKTKKVAANSSIADQAIAFARSQLNKPYVWGATGPDSWDCSGLTQAAYKAAGITLPRTTYDQVDVGTRVSEADLQPGDLIFFYSDVSHVGLYIGGGNMIHAPHTGTVVKIAPITEMPFYAAVRPY